MEKWIVQTTDGIFLALRYTSAAAEQARVAFANRWPQGVVVVKEGVAPPPF